MFTQISWTDYITTVVVLLAAYYLFIGYRYFRVDLLQLLSGRKMLSGDKVKVKAAVQRFEKENIQEAAEEPAFQIAQAASDELQAYLQEASSNKLNEEEVKNGLRKLLGKYPKLKESSFCELIENLIINECELNLSFELDAMQVKELWPS
jgi:hypothetical protein